ncbi:MAG: hypothetical protein PHZ26_02905 [Candidatus Gracilibacteria bacterium]|nr:hypothetical protein [Candidatus Gracilibacteria bacterium]MDD2908678.1 hypothetical protein [Candidatus Gracilibacteria bacterium]
MTELIDSKPDEKFHLQSFLKKLNKTLRKKETINPSELIILIKKNSLKNNELLDIHKTLEISLNENNQDDFGHKDDYEKLLNYIKVIFGERYIAQLKKENQKKVATIIQKGHDLVLKKGTPETIREIYFYFSTIIYQDEIQKKEIHKLESMIKNSFKTIKGSIIDSGKMSTIKNRIDKFAKRMDDKTDASNLIGIYDEFTEIVCDEKIS